MNSRDDDIKAIHALLDQARDAWGRGDGAAYGAAFAEDATDVTFVGTIYLAPASMRWRTAGGFRPSA